MEFSIKNNVIAVHKTCFFVHKLPTMVSLYVSVTKMFKVFKSNLKPLEEFFLCVNSLGKVYDKSPLTSWKVKEVIIDNFQILLF